jgi:hypothetical protein
MDVGNRIRGESRMASADRHDQLEPLTRRNQAGELYTRREVVETQIHVALGLDPAALYARARISDRMAADYLKRRMPGLPHPRRLPSGRS